MQSLTLNPVVTSETLEDMFRSVAKSAAVLIRCGGKPSKGLSPEVMDILQKEYDITVEAASIYGQR